MLLSKKINIIISSSKDMSFLKKINFKNIKMGDIVTIDIKDLPLNSHRMVKVKCQICGVEKEVRYQAYNRSTNNGIDEYYCQNKECINTKRELSIMKKYGVKNVFELKEIQNKIKETNNIRYGVDNPLQSDMIKNKMKKTNLEKYGCENVFQNDDIKKKIIKTNNERYGVSFPQQSSKIRNKYSALHRSSSVENELFDYIKRNSDGVEKNVKNIIDGYELDIYIPSLKLAFEFNGLYWHNELNKNKNYHLNKTNLCENKGISLIHIYEDQWEFKRPIIESMILNKLNKNKYKIFARKCEIKEINDNSLVKNFLNTNHLQGYCLSKIKLGLYYNNELVSLMTFGSKRISMGAKSSNLDYELIRFCSLLNINVIGGASKLLKYFILNYKPKSVTTYADRSWSSGKTYLKMGFKFIKNTNANYYYIIDKKRHYRFKFRKSELIRKGENPNLTEKEIMLKNKIYRIYDSGNKKFLI